MPIINLREHVTTAGIHTVQVRVPKGSVKISDEDYNKKIKSKYGDTIDVNRKIGLPYDYIKCNPNVVTISRSENRLLDSYSVFKKNLLHILDEIQLEADESEIAFNRVDFAFNSTDPDFYKKYSILYRYVVYAMTMVLEAEAVEKKKKSRVDSTVSFENFTLEQKSDRVKNSGVELQYYDKEKESGLDSVIKARCELRLQSQKRPIAQLSETTIQYWEKRFRNCLKLDADYNQVDERVNFYLMKAYREEKARKRKFHLGHFLDKNYLNVITWSQLYDFISMIAADDGQDLSDKAIEKKIRGQIEEGRTGLRIIRRETVAKLYDRMITQMTQYFAQ